MWNKSRKSLLLNRRYSFFRCFTNQVKVYDNIKIIESKNLYEDKNTKISIRESSKYIIPIPQCDRSFISSIVYRLFL